jgi:hypothetical protein
MRTLRKDQWSDLNAEMVTLRADNERLRALVAGLGEPLPPAVSAALMITATAPAPPSPAPTEATYALHLPPPGAGGVAPLHARPLAAASSVAGSAGPDSGSPPPATLDLPLASSLAAAQEAAAVAAAAAWMDRCAVPAHLAAAAAAAVHCGGAGIDVAAYDMPEGLEPLAALLDESVPA